MMPDNQPTFLSNLSVSHLYHARVLLSLDPSGPQVLSTLVRLYQQAPSPDLAAICQCLMFLNDAAAVADILLKLLKGSQVQGAQKCSAIALSAVC